MKILKDKKVIATSILSFILATANNICFAEGIGTAEVNSATENIKRVITSIAMPLGGVLIFASVVVAGIIINVATNNTGSLLGS